MLPSMVDDFNFATASSLEAARLENRDILARRLTFGVGSIGTAIVYIVPSTLLLYYLTTSVHVPPAFAGLLILAPKIISIFTDPIVGHVSDRLKARSEMHRRMFMFVGALSAAIGLWAV